MNTIKRFLTHPKIQLLFVTVIWLIETILPDVGGGGGDGGGG